MPPHSYPRGVNVARCTSKPANTAGLCRASSPDSVPVEHTKHPVSDGSDWHPARDSRLTAGDTLSVDASFDPSAVDTDRLKVFNDEVRERAGAKIGRVKPPEFTNAHLPAIVDRDPRAVIEHTQSGGHR